MSESTIRLDADQLEHLAVLIAQQLSTSPVPALVDAAALAEHLGVSRKYVYANADQLGGRRLGGPRGRLRFDPSEASAAFASTEQTKRPAARRRKQPADTGSVLRVRS